MNYYKTAAKKQIFYQLCKYFALKLNKSCTKTI